MRYSSLIQRKINKVFDITDRPLLSAADIGFSLFQRCGALVDSIFDARGITSPAARNDRVNSVFGDIESFAICPKEDWSYEFEIIQGEEAIKDQLDLHFVMALRQAVYAAYIWKKLLPPLMSSLFPYSESHVSKEKSLLIADMVTAMEHCSRHLTALWLLKNLQGRHYDGRASKGGHSRPKPPAKKAQDQLLRAMITGMLYNDPNGLKRTRRYPEKVAHEFAERISCANRDYQMLDIASLDRLKGDVHTLLLERLNASDGLSDYQSGKRLIARRLRANLAQCRSEKTGLMEAEAARMQGRLEGVRAVLVQQLDARFGELSDAVFDQLYSIETLEECQVYLERLPRAVTLEEVIPSVAS